MSGYIRQWGTTIRNGLRPMEESLRNRPLLALEGLAASLVANLATAFASMFANRMGATDYHIGLLNSLPPLFGLLVLLPGAIATDRMRNKRRMVEISILLLAVCYLGVGLSPFLGDLRIWGLVFLFSLSNSPGSLYNVSWQAFFSDVVPPDLRNSFLTLRTKVSLFTGTLVVLSTGLMLSYLPRNDGDRIVLYQGFYVVAFLASFLQIAYLRRVRGGDKTRVGDASRRRLGTTMRALLQNRPFLGFAAISLLLYVGWQLSWPLFFITQVRYLQANEAWLSWISIVSSLLNLATAGFWSRYIDRHGVRWTVVVGAFGMALNPALFAVSTFVPAPYALPSLLLLNSVVGLTFTAFQLSSIQCLLEVLGENDKTLQISIFTSMTLLSNILSPMAGVWLYSTLGSDRSALALSMLASTLIRLLATGAFAYRWWRLRGTPDSGQRTRTPR